MFGEYTPKNGTCEIFPISLQSTEIKYKAQRPYLDIKCHSLQRLFNKTMSLLRNNKAILRHGYIINPHKKLVKSTERII
jgi:hypothetical protein